MNKEATAMQAFPIRSDDDLVRAAELIDELWDSESGTPEGDLLEVMSDLVDLYEQEHSTLEPGDPVEIIRFKLAELGWSQNTLAKRSGYSSGRISEILSRRRPMTLAMVQKLSQTLGLPAGLLVHDVRANTRGIGWVALPADLVRQARSEAVCSGQSFQDFVIEAVSQALRPTDAGFSTTLLQQVLHFTAGACTEGAARDLDPCHGFSASTEGDDERCSKLELVA